MPNFQLAALVAGISAALFLFRSYRKRKFQQLKARDEEAVKAELPQKQPNLPTRLGDDTAIVQVDENIRNFRPKVGSFVRIASDGTDDFAQAGSGDCRLFSDFLDLEEARRMFDVLSRPVADGGEIDYQQWYHMPDLRRRHRALRPLTRVKVAMTVAPDAQGRWPLYRFPVNNQHRYGETRPMTPTVEKVCKMVERALEGKFVFNHAVVLLYRGLDDRIGFHQDKTLDLVPGAPIVSVSLGCERVYMLRDSIRSPTLTQAFVFPHGAMFCLGPKTNQDFYHSIVKEVDPDGQPLPAPASAPRPHRLDFDTTVRVSLTFRSVATFQDENGIVYGQGANYQELDWPVELNGQHRYDEALTEDLA